ncbi:MAG: hypothetical protein DIJKHBIC_04717 [Thermoanaerobaculia bacterium]|nr:hypothetical protein [Thermoanaerobaculia bacterium]
MVWPLTQGACRTIRRARESVLRQSHPSRARDRSRRVPLLRVRRGYRRGRVCPGRPPIAPLEEIEFLEGRSGGVPPPSLLQRGRKLDPEGFHPGAVLRSRSAARTSAGRSRPPAPLPLGRHHPREPRLHRWLAGSESMAIRRENGLAKPGAPPPRPRGPGSVSSGPGLIVDRLRSTRSPGRRGPSPCPLPVAAGRGERSEARLPPAWPGLRGNLIPNEDVDLHPKRLERVVHGAAGAPDDS